MSRGIPSIAALVRHGQWQSAWVALLCASVLMTAASLYSLHQFAFQAAGLSARSLAFASEPAVRFKDLQAMRDMAEQVARDEQLAEVVVWDRAGQAWLSYKRPATGGLAEVIDRLFFPEPVSARIGTDEQPLGRIALRSDGQFLLRYLGLVLLSMTLCVMATAVAILSIANRLSSKIVAPVNELAALTRTVRTTRTFQRRAELGSVREINALADDFNALLNELESHQLVIAARHEDLEKANESLHHASRHDGLTQLPNRVYLMEHLGQVLRQSDELQQRAALLFIDVDKFKDVNDSLGHEAGDALLVELAKRLQASVRETDFVSRFGGDEFIVVISPMRDLTELDLCVDRLRASLAPNWQFRDGPAMGLSVTIGGAVYPDHAQSLDELIRQADEAMYRSKPHLPDTPSRQ